MEKLGGFKVKAPADVLAKLMAEVKRCLYPALPERSWFTQQARVKAALTLPAKWLDQRKVEVSAERYEAILLTILETIKGHGKKPSELGPYPCAYLHACVESHLRHHGDEYYEEGKGIRNRVKLAMAPLEKARLGADGTVPVLAEAHRATLAALDVGKRKPGKATPAPDQADLFGCDKHR